MKKIITLVMLCMLYTPALYAHEDFDVVDNQDYIALCGDCHFPHQAQWMPERSWRYFLTNKGLGDHFGVKVETKGLDILAIYQYLQSGALETSENKIIKRMGKKYDPNIVPIRIITNAHYEKMHRKILNDEKRFITDNAKVKYQGDCVACHEDGLKGDFSERSAKVPGFQKSDWE